MQGYDIKLINQSVSTRARIDMLNNNQYKVKQITEFFKDMNFDAGYELISNSNLSDINILVCKGNAEFYKRNHSNAYELYDQAMEIDGNLRISRYFYLWASKYLAEGDLVQAFQNYQEAIDIEPDFVDAYTDLGALMIEIGEFESAKKCYTDALALDPEDPKIRKSLNSLARF